MVVAGHRHHPALGEDAREIGVLEDIAGAVDAGRLAVPHAEDPIMQGAGEEIGLLTAPHRGGGEVFVDPFLEDDLLGGEQLGGPMRLLIEGEAAQRRSAVARDETGGVQSGAGVNAALIEQDPQQRLDAGNEDPTGAENIFVVQGYIGVAHGKILPQPLALGLAMIYGREENVLAKGLPQRG